MAGRNSCKVESDRLFDQSKVSRNCRLHVFSHQELPNQDFCANSLWLWTNARSVKRSRPIIMVGRPANTNSLRLYFLPNPSPESTPRFLLPDLHTSTKQLWKRPQNLPPCLEKPPPASQPRFAEERRELMQIMLGHTTSNSSRYGMAWTFPFRLKSRCHNPIRRCATSSKTSIRRCQCSPTWQTASSNHAIHEHKIAAKASSSRRISF